MNKAKRGNNIFLAGVITLLLLITILAILYPMVTGRSLGSPQNANVVSIPTVTTVVSSSKDGSVYKMKAKFSLEMGDGAAQDVNAADLESRVTEILSTLDYDKINAEGADEYIKSSISDGLRGYVDESDIKQVYITELQSGDVHIYSDDDTPNNRRNEVMRELFQGMD